jgi:phosphoribosylformylglycinamidine cyclo-ligase
MSSYKKEIIAPGDKASKLAHEVCVQSYKNCPAVHVIPRESNNFRGPVGFTWKKHVLEKMMEWEDPKDGIIMQEMENDGAGGKPQFFTLVGTEKVFQGLGWEIITMTADDFARSGRFPAVMCNDLQIKKITEQNFPLFDNLMKGYHNALTQSDLVNITGEVAVMKHSITAFCDTGEYEQLILTWSASCIGLSHKKLLIDNSKIKPGMLIIGFWEPGYRCNGGTFFTELILSKFGPEPEKIMANDEAKNFARKLSTPSISYARTLNRIMGWNMDGSIDAPKAKVAGAAHITGGGIWGKFGEILPSGVGAHLHSLMPPGRVLLEAQEMSRDLPEEKQLSDCDAYETFHGGYGMILVVPDKENADKIIKQAQKEHMCAHVIGETKKREEMPARLMIESKFNQGGTLMSKD